MGQLLTPTTWQRTRTRRTPVPKDGWAPISPAGELITPPFAKTGWAPAGMISLADAADLIGTTYDDLTAMALKGKFTVTHHDGVFFMEAYLAEYVRAFVEDSLSAPARPTPRQQ